MIEDYAPGSPHHPLSSVALQFLVMVFSSFQPCSTQTECFRFPAIILHPSSKTMFWTQIKSTNMTLTCMANETSSYYWERQNGNIPFTSIGVRTNTLTLINVKPEDAGRYRCVAFVCNIVSHSFSNYATVSVNGKQLRIPYSAIMRQGKILVNSLFPRIGREIYGEFGFRVKILRKLVRKYW